MRIERLLYAALSLCLAMTAIPAAAVPAQQTVTTGTYHPGDGTADTIWQITSSNTLIWGSHAFVPVGVVFRPTSLLSDQADSDAAWPSDAAALETLRKSGVRQIIVDLTSSDPDAIPLVAVRPESLQRLISYLDKNDFQYGLDLNAFPPSGLTGVSIDPALYRQPAPSTTEVSSVQGIEGLVRAHYWLVSTRDDSILSSGETNVTGNTAKVNVGDTGGQNTVLLVYPTRLLGGRTLEGRHCPDIWASQDRVRDDLLLYLGKINFGQGLRFFIDPIRDNFGLYGTLANGFIPNSDAYRRSFKVWLTSKYGGRLSLLQRSWAVTQEDLPDFDAAAKCMPLWNGKKGIESIYDPIGDKQYAVDTGRSSVWQDIHAFQEVSLTDAMNGVALSLKHGVANVPIVYRWSSVELDNPASNSNGYDGLMLTTSSHADSLIGACAETVSSVDRSSRSLWLIATQLAQTPASDQSAAKPTLPVIAHDVLGNDTDTLTKLGVRGIFNDLGANPDSTSSDSLAVVRSIEVQLDLSSSSLGNGTPNNIYYPTSLRLSSASPRQLGDKSWWLPAPIVSSIVSLGPNVEGYSMRGPANLEYVLYAKTSTPQQVTVHFAQLDHPFQLLLDGSAKMLPIKHGKTDLLIGPQPVVLGGISTFPIPEGALEAEVGEVNRLIKLGIDDHAPMDYWETQLSRVQDSPLISEEEGGQGEYQELTKLEYQLRNVVSPYLWIEAESPIMQTQAYSLESQDTSSGAYLWFDGKSTGNSAPSADYPFNCTIPGDYDIWAAVGPASSGRDYSGSDIIVSFDDGSILSSSDARPQGDTYGTVANLEQNVSGGFVWERLTSVHLSAGQHVMHVSVNGDSSSTGRSSAAIDCFCLDRDIFEPNGVDKPTF